MKMEDKLLKIIKNYGVLAQLKYLQSEVFEFNEAVIRCEEAYLNDCSTSHYKNLKEHIVEELADVEVMLLQIKEYYKIDSNEILIIMNEKIERQLKRIEDSNESNSTDRKN